MSLDTTIEAANGKHVKARTVFAHAIKFMKDEAIKLISDETGDEQFKADDIQWVLTVPAIWTPRAKQFMREAVYEVRFALPRAYNFINTRKRKMKQQQQEEKINYYADLANNTLVIVIKSTMGIVIRLIPFIKTKWL